MEICKREHEHVLDSLADVVCDLGTIYANRDHARVQALAPSGVVEARQETLFLRTLRKFRQAQEELDQALKVRSGDEDNREEEDAALGTTAPRDPDALDAPYKEGGAA